MASDSSSTTRGKLKLSEPSTVTARPKGKPRAVQIADEEVMHLFRLEERFEDHGEIGHGGMGAVHRVLEKTLHRPVAMKLLGVERAANNAVKSRFLAEAQVTGQLEHPNIVPVYELGSDDAGVLFFTMRLIEGQTFSDWLRTNDIANEELLEGALEIFFRVCDALSFAHSRGVIHRDVKPANIMVGEHGQVYLMDWGIARVLPSEPGEAPSSTKTAEGTAVTARRRTTTLTAPIVDEQGLVLGTYAYMSPEQARSAIEDIDARTDVFGLGAVLFRIVVGRPPIEGNTPYDALAKAAEAKIPDVTSEVVGTLQRALLEIAMQAMQRSRAQRFQSVAALKQATQTVLRGRVRYPMTRASKGTVVVREGDRANDAYFIRTGTCIVYRERDGQRHHLQTIGPGEVFGETAVFTEQPRNATVEALTDVELIVVPGRHLAESVGLESWMGAFVRALGTRFSERSQRVTELESESLVVELVAHAWRQLAFAGAREPDGSLSLPLIELVESLPPRLAALGPRARRLLEVRGFVVQALRGVDRVVGRT